MPQIKPSVEIPNDQYFHVRDTATCLKCPHSIADAFAANRKLKLSRKIGIKWIFSRAALDLYMQGGR